MPPTDSKPAAVAQVTPAQALNSSAPHVTQRQRFRRNWLQRLTSMPPWMYREIIDRLMRGDLPIAVARWIMRHDERGGLNRITSVNTLRRYLQVLAEEVDRQKCAHPAPPMSQVHAEVIRDAITAANQLEVTLPAPGKGTYITVPDYIAERVENFNAEQYLIAVVQCCWETLERFRKTEEELADRGLPVQHLADAHAKIAGKMIDALAELRQHETMELLRQKMVNSEDFSEFARLSKLCGGLG